MSGQKRRLPLVAVLTTVTMTVVVLALSRLYGSGFGMAAALVLLGATLIVCAGNLSAGDSEKKYQTLFEKSADAILIIEGERFVDCNSATVRMLGYKNKKELLDTHPSQLSPETQPDGKNSFVKANEMIAIAFARGSHRFEWDHKRQNGEVFPVEVLLTAVPSRGADCLHVVWRDITERKQAEKKVEQFAAFARNNPAPVLKTELDGTITMANPAAERLLGEDVVGEFIQTVLPESGDLYGAFSQAGTLMQFEQKLGEEIYLFSCRCDEPTRAVYVYGSNITEFKRLQALESRAARLDTAGTIAGQVAHDFNNLLAPLMAWPDIIREKLPREHPVLKYLDDMEKSARKIADINQQLLTLGRRGHYNQDVFNLNSVIRQAVKEMAPMVDETTITTDLAPDLMNIHGGGAQIHRVIVNLLCNAVDAIQGPGRIDIRTENYYVDDVKLAYGCVPKGEYVKLTISDTGCGIPDGIVQKILDPFFTTKASDKNRGSGLGLSVVDAVVKDHKGYLDLKTEQGRGTSFFIYFPTTDRLADDSSSGDITGGNESILIVDDDDGQRNVSTALLRKLGYDVHAVESGEDAVAFLREHPQDLLLLDMIMPGGIDGVETYRQVLAINPRQKAIIVSGFSESDRIRTAQELGAGAFVRKPLTMKSIAAAVRTELDRKPEPTPA